MAWAFPYWSSDWALPISPRGETLKAYCHEHRRGPLDNSTNLGTFKVFYAEGAGMGCFQDGPD